MDGSGGVYLASSLEMYRLRSGLIADVPVQSFIGAISDLVWDGIDALYCLMLRELLSIGLAISILQRNTGSGKQRQKLSKRS